MPDEQKPKQEPDDSKDDYLDALETPLYLSETADM